MAYSDPHLEEIGQHILLDGAESSWGNGVSSWRLSALVYITDGSCKYGLLLINRSAMARRTGHGSISPAHIVPIATNRRLAGLGGVRISADMQWSVHR
jgi:hypothetical protein